MPIREFELFHGAVLTKLVRGDRALTLRMIETRPTDAWSTYRVNDQVNVLLKHSLSPRIARRENATAWQFVFSRDQMRQLRTANTWAALVCGSKTVGRSDMEICLLDPTQLEEVLDLASDDQQSVTVKRIEGKSLRVSSPQVRKELVVPRSRADNWDIPGS
jgi:hypothetical protein